MSKKNKSGQTSHVDQVAMQEHAAEYRIIRNDLLKVVALNVVYLVAILALYYTNLKSGYLEAWFDKILHF